MKTFLTTIALLLYFQFGTAQLNVEAKRIDTKIEIDGKLNEEIWASATPISNFTTWQPVPKLEPRQQTEVSLLYDNEALYVGVKMFVASRDSIMTELTQRDDVGNTDWVGVILDTYGNATDAFEFIVGATGVQFDAKLSDQGEDNNWDAVWFSGVDLTDDYWSAEFKIPYSAIRFSKQKDQAWKMNIMRREAISGERSSWHPIVPEAPVWLAQMGNVVGISDIKAPLRLSISPYLSLYAQQYNDGANGISSTGYSYNGGMDLKYGINDAFTLDMTLIPDFGQVQSDNIILNLSPFEVRYDERRQFFTEGTELFNKGGLFYSRRVGGNPIGQYSVGSQLHDNEELVTNPGTSQLINASKISGRTGKGLGIGVFNAIAKETFATARNIETGEERQIRSAPLTNYNVLVFDQNLKNNSTVSLINTNVWRSGNEYYNANVTATEFDFKLAEQKFSITGGLAVSQKYYSQSDNEFGERYSLSFNKIKGNFNYSVSYDQLGENFDSNDLGFQAYNNERRLGANAFYQITEPFGSFNRAQFWFNYSYARLIQPDEFVSMHFNTGFWMQTKNFLNINLWANYRPKNYNFYEPRDWGRYYEEPASANVGFWMGTDGRKKFRINGYVFFQKANEQSRDGYSYAIRPRYRFSDKLNMSLAFEFDKARNTPRYVTHQESDIIFGKRMRTTIENSFRLNYTFSDKMGLDMRIRHYWSKVQYAGFNMLTEHGGLGNTSYNGANDFTFNLLNIDLNYRWRFASGSDIIFNWKNNISGVLAGDAVDFYEESYIDGIRGLSNLPENNSISLRVIYYLDYQQLRQLL